MIKHLTIILAFLMTLSTQAEAARFLRDQSITAEDLRSVQSVYVRLNDLATSGCWTNLRAVRAYAEKNLRIAGIRITQDPEASNVGNKQFHFVISVSADRARSGECLGTVTVGFGGWTNLNGWAYYATLGELELTNSSRSNLNRSAMGMVRTVFSLLPK